VLKFNSMIFSIIHSVQEMIVLGFDQNICFNWYNYIFEFDPDGYRRYFCSRHQVCLAFMAYLQEFDEKAKQPYS
jgi:hypothetical protein